MRQPSSTQHTLFALEPELHLPLYVLLESVLGKLVVEVVREVGGRHLPGFVTGLVHVEDHLLYRLADLLRFRGCSKEN